MCGIFASLSESGYQAPSKDIVKRLDCRGPDCWQLHQLKVGTEGDAETIRYASFQSTVLSVRGEDVVKQPLIDPNSGSILCWNGDAWKIEGLPLVGNDTIAVFTHLLEASAQCSGDLSGCSALLKAIQTILGPYAFVFYDAPHHRLFYGRDCLGRRSLLKGVHASGDLLLCSVADTETDGPWSWTEVDADGIYVVDLRRKSLSPQHIPYVHNGSASNGLELPYPSLSKTISTLLEPIHPESQSVKSLEGCLQESLVLRVKNIGRAAQNGLSLNGIGKANLAILFSGGLDCTVLARLAHDALPVTESVDLLNVAFQNPRVHGLSDDPVQTLAAYASCPDRITGFKSYHELQKVCPTRLWRFVEINIPYSEMLEHREEIVSLIYPHNTEMDFSIASAFYFAARGAGVISSESSDTSEPYCSPARILLSGLGADELFGGYTRHTTAFQRNGLPGLAEELELDVNRLGRRNLGRDDRVISNWRRHVRYPFLDEDLLSWALSIPVSQKFGCTGHSSDDEAHRLAPEKRVLRALAWRLGMTEVSSEKKRAVQFGARTAKMVSGRSKGTQLLSRTR